MSLIEHCPECEAAWERGHKAGRAYMVAQGHDTWKDMHAVVVDQLEEARQQLRGAVEALEAIKRDCGKVCPEFELCTHVACQSSYAAWAIADAYLTGGQCVAPPSSLLPKEDQ